MLRKIIILHAIICSCSYITLETRYLGKRKEQFMQKKNSNVEFKIKQMFSSILFMCWVYWLGHVSDCVFDCQWLLLLRLEELLVVHDKHRNLSSILQCTIKDWKREGAQNQLINFKWSFPPPPEVNVCKMFFWLDSFSSLPPHSPARCSPHLCNVIRAENCGVVWIEELLPNVV